MADNISVPDSTGTPRIVRTTETATVSVPWHAVGNAAGSLSAEVIQRANFDANVNAQMVALTTTAVNLVYNGTTWDRLRAAPGSLGAAAVSSDGVKATYRRAVINIAPVATPTDVLEIAGSATKTVRIKKIKVTGAATAAGQIVCQLIKRTTLGAGAATRTAVTAGRHDTNDAAPTGLVNTISVANFTTPGTVQGNLGSGRLGMGAVGTGVCTPVIWDFCQNEDKAIVLRGVAENVCVNFAGAAVPAGGVLDFEVELEEDAS